MIEVVTTHAPESTPRVMAPVKVSAALGPDKDGNKLPETVSIAGLLPGESEIQTHLAEAPETLDSALASVNDFVQSINRELHFTVDAELEKTIIKVIDSGSGDVIRQIPEDVFLELARNLKNDGELHLVNALT